VLITKIHILLEKRLIGDIFIPTKVQNCKFTERKLHPKDIIRNVITMRPKKTHFGDISYKIFNYEVRSFIFNMLFMGLCFPIKSLQIIIF